MTAAEKYDAWLAMRQAAEAELARKNNPLELPSLRDQTQWHLNGFLFESSHQSFCAAVAFRLARYLELGAPYGVATLAALQWTRVHPPR